VSLVTFILHKTLSRALVPVARSVVAGLACLLAMQSETQNAIANGDTRTLNLIHAHTNETISALTVNMIKRHSISSIGSYVIGGLMSQPKWIHVCLI
jgi:hypothetical protein